MSASLNEISKQLKAIDKKVQLIYAFNGTGKTRLSREFKLLVEPTINGEAELDELAIHRKRILYYNAFTEDLFYWDNDLEFGIEPKLKIHPNSFTKWIFEKQGQDLNTITKFQNYSDKKLTPKFNEEKKIIKDGQRIIVEGFTEVSFSYERGNAGQQENVKISKGEESNFVWCVFHTLLEEVIGVLNVLDPTERETDQFDQLEYVFIDDPVSSLDENNLIALAVDLSHLIKSSASDLKFIITTHNPLFYNVMYNELKNKGHKKYFLEKLESGEYILNTQSDDSPFSYHLFLKKEIEEAVETDQLKKYHYNFFRNILEKTSTFLGYDKWGDLINIIAKGEPDPYLTRIINISSHAKHSTEEVNELSPDDKRVLEYLIGEFNKLFHFK